MPKVPFFKLAKELGFHRPDDLKSRLADSDIQVHSPSSMLDESTVERIREIVKRESAPVVAAPAPVAAPPAPTAPVQEAPAPPAATEPVAAEPAVAPEAPVVPEAPVAPPAPPEPRPVTRVIRRTTDRDGHVTVQSAEPRPAQQPPSGKPQEPQRPGGKPKAKPALITPAIDGGLSPEADFGIVRAAVPVPVAPARPARPRGPEGPPQNGPSGPGGPPRRGAPPMAGRPGGPPPTTGPGAPPDASKGPARPGAPAKKGQKRTVFTDRDQQKPRQQHRATDFSTTIRRRKRRGTGGRPEAGAQPVLEGPIVITGPLSVGELAERALMKPAQIITQLLGMGVLATVNQMIEPEQAMAVLEKLEIEALFERDLAEQASWRLSTTTVDAEDRAGGLRPPVVTILGHVDHGKTTLLDSIRKTNVTASEFGGITQHIGAYQVEIKGQKITFLDTPGHAAFTAMRARGANLTDVAVLVVAADDGVQPQTIEAIDHAKAAKVPIIIAINKIDVPDAQPEVVKQQLTAHELVAEEWGGETIMVPVSAKKGQGVEQLLEMILLVSEVADLHAVADKPARGAVVESKLDKQRGPVATILVQDGTLRVGDAVVIGMVSGRVRAMVDDKGRPVKEAGPSTPVEITGISDVPVAGDLFEVVDSEKAAREVAETRQQKARDERLQTTHVSLQNLSSLVAAGQVKDLNLIVKADVAGSIEAISQALGQVTQREIRLNTIHSGVGDVTESDVLLASASEAIIIGFHVHMESQGRALAEELGIDVRIYQIIYDLVDDVEKAMVGMLTPVFEEAILGHAEVRAVFKLSRAGTVAGCYVTDGLVRRGSKVRVRRAGEVVTEGTLDNLKHLKDDVREMAQGFECGISMDRFNAWKEGDIIESYVVKEQRRETL